MEKIYIRAYTASNLGDDLFIKVLCERYQDKEFVLWAPKKYKRSFQGIKNLKILKTDSIITRGINFALGKLGMNYTLQSFTSKKCVMRVTIGGSIFMEEENWDEKLKKNKGKYLSKQPSFIIGANFGPYKDIEFYNEYKNHFKEYTDICFRDMHSYRLFKDFKNVRMAPDIIFQVDKTNVNMHDQKDYVAISVIKPSIRKYLEGYDDIYYQKLRDVIMKFIDNGHKIVLMSFCEQEGDVEAIDSIRSLLPKLYLNEVSNHLYKHNIDKTLEVIANAKFIIGTRFHAMILGWVFNKSVFPIVYNEKMINVMKDVKFQGTYTDFPSLHKLEVEEVYNSMETNQIDVSEQIIAAEKQFEKLDEYLL